MRTRFDEQLELLNNELITMGALCEDAIACAIKALLNHDLSLIEGAENAEREIDRKERDIEALCMRLLLQQQPVARDLRLISSALKMITDMERIGDQAADIAELVTFADIPKSISVANISDMAQAVIKMVTESIDAFVKKDAALAIQVIDYDDVVDDLFVRIKSDIINMIAGRDKNLEAITEENSHSAVDILMIAKYLERIGDHATNIAEWVVFSITGRHGKEE